MGCVACGEPGICKGCETIQAWAEGWREFPPHQEAALRAYWDADEPEAMRAAYHRLPIAGLPLCNVEPSFGQGTFQ
jgi:hypothetical protein